MKVKCLKFVFQESGLGGYLVCYRLHRPLTLPDVVCGLCAWMGLSTRVSFPETIGRKSDKMYI